MDGIETILEDFQRLKDNCQKLERQKILVGINGDAGSEVLKIAHAHEYGVPGKLPERSFIRKSFDVGQAELGEIVDEQVSKVMAGQTSPEAAANAIGAQAAQMVQNFIDENKVEPKSDFSKKQIHTTLYETGTHIRDRISWKVEDA